MSTLGQRVKQARLHAKLTQVQLAGAVGLSQQQISTLETDQGGETTALVKIARACNVNPFWLEDGSVEMLDPLLRTGEATRAVVEAMEPLAEYERHTAASLVITYAREATKKRVNE